MITDNQVKKLKKYLRAGMTLEKASSRAGIDEKTGRKYRDLDKLPSELKSERTRHWRTRPDPFTNVWHELKPFLEINPGLQAKTLFQHLQRQYPGQFEDGQLRTFQRQVKRWRATCGPAKEIYFPQVHHPGKLSQSDFTHMSGLKVTINHQPFNHLLYHFVLTYSNWETGTICFSESFESLSTGFQNALWELGGVPELHQTDRLSTAVQKSGSLDEFTDRYQGLLNYYKIGGKKTQAASPHENGDVEQSHHRFKQALDQALMLRGSRDFGSRKEYEKFLMGLFAQLNSGRKKRFSEERDALGALPASRLDSCTKLTVKVGPSSTIRIKHNVYSVHSRLIGETVTLRLYAEHIEVWYGQRHLDNLPRLRGSEKCRINYRHLIDWLVRKPGAFANYRYRKELFPSSRFRVAYDQLLQNHTESRAAKEYLEILELAAKVSETETNNALGYLIQNDQKISKSSVSLLLEKEQHTTPSVTIAPVYLTGYDTLLTAHKSEVRI